MRLRLLLAIVLLSLPMAACSGSDSDRGTATSGGAEMWTGPALPTTEMSDADKASVDASLNRALGFAETTGATGMWVGIYDPEKGK